LEFVRKEKGERREEKKTAGIYDAEKTILFHV